MEFVLFQNISMLALRVVTARVVTARVVTDRVFVVLGIVTSLISGRAIHRPWQLLSCVI